MRPLPTQRIVYIGTDRRETVANAVTAMSLRHKSLDPDALVIRYINRQQLEADGLYTRPVEQRYGQDWDSLSGAPMTTDHAIARFFIPHLMGYEGTALFIDGDMLVRWPIEQLWLLTEIPAWSTSVLACVQHAQAGAPTVGPIEKKDGATQTYYERKNWSSVMLMNCAHASWRSLDLSILNTVPGRALHGFRWFSSDQMIGLPPAWNYLVGVSQPIDDPAIVHYTLGVPGQLNAVASPYDAEWWEYATAAQPVANPVR